MRYDFYHYDEAGAMALYSEGLQGKSRQEVFDNWLTAIQKYLVFPVGKSGDGENNVRLVLGDLTEQESSEWVGKISWALKIPDGRLVIEAAFEPTEEMFEEFIEEEEIVYFFDVPPGDYQTESNTTYLEFSDIDSGSHKFYEVTVEGDHVTVRYGRIGDQGQTSTKSYPSPEKAQKEADKKIQAKLRKGYEPAILGQTEKRSISERRRVDVSVYNEANSFFLASKSLCGWDPTKAFELVSKGSKEENFKALQEGLYIPVCLHQDDGFIARVLVGDLNEQEAAEWVGRITWKLNIPDGKLAISGGWAIFEWYDDPEFTREYVRFVDVPPGEYLVEVYTYVQTVTGEECLQEALTGGPREGETFGEYWARQEPLGSYFRRRWPGQEFPSWLLYECGTSGGIDPEYEDYWETYFEKLPDREMDKLERDLDLYVNFLIRLAPLTETPPMPEWVYGCFAWQERREPEECPLGIMGANVRGLSEW